MTLLHCAEEIAASHGYAVERSGSTLYVTGRDGLRLAEVTPLGTVETHVHTFRSFVCALELATEMRAARRDDVK